MRTNQGESRSIKAKVTGPLLCGGSDDGISGELDGVSPPSKAPSLLRSAGAVHDAVGLYATILNSTAANVWHRPVSNCFAFWSKEPFTTDEIE